MLINTIQRPRTTRAARTVIGGAVALATTGAAVLLGASGASASSFSGVTLAPGASQCVSQYASRQIRGDGYATVDGARFKLVFRGNVLDSSPGRTGAFFVERRTSTGTFPGPDYYSFCAYNTGIRNTTVQLLLRTDGEF